MKRTTTHQLMLKLLVREEDSLKTNLLVFLLLLIFLNHCYHLKHKLTNSSVKCREQKLKTVKTSKLSTTQ